MPRLGHHVFINVPFDTQFEHLYVALIGTLVGLGYNPRSSLEVPPASDRLRRIFKLVGLCDWSIHDLSRVQVSRDTPRCPRFNMPFEAGLAVALCLFDRNKKWYLLEEVDFRVLKSTSDLNGYEVYIHEGTVKEMIAAVLDICPWSPNQPGPTLLYRLYQHLSKVSKELKKQNHTLFRPRSFLELRYAAKEIANRLNYED